MEVSLRELSMAREVDHIVAKAIQQDSRIVTIGGLVSFSTHGEWTCRYAIEREVVTFVEKRSGRVTSVTGYPTREIRQASRRAEGGR